MPTTKQTSTRARKPAARKAASKPSPAGLCMNCMPIGHVQVFTMLIVAVFALASVLSIATYRLNQLHSVAPAPAPVLQAGA